MERKKTADEGYPVYLFFEGNNFEAQKFFGITFKKPLFPWLSKIFA